MEREDLFITMYRIHLLPSFTASLNIPQEKIRKDRTGRGGINGSVHITNLSQRGLQVS